MRISIDCRMWNSGGIGTYLKNIVPQFSRMFPNSKVFLLGKKEEIMYLSNDRIEIVDFRAPIYSIREQIEFIKIIPKCDIFFSPQYNVPLTYKGILITTIHDVFHISDENENKSTVKMLYAKNMLKAALRKSTIVFTDSQFTLDEMGKFGLPHLDKVKVVPLAPHFSDSQIEGTKPVGKENSHLLYVGNIKPHKNLSRLVSAYQKLVEKETIDIPLLIVGESENFITGIDGFKETIENSKWGSRIEFTGRISDDELIGLYKSATALAFPSLYEGFGLPPLEAMQCGCPVIASNAASLPEVCGDAALYCDPYDIEDIADKIKQVIVDSHLRSTLIEKGSKRVHEFSWDKTAEKFRDIIEEFI